MVSNKTSDEQKTTTKTAAAAPRRQATAEGTGTEPDRAGPHRPGMAPGQHVDTGPVSVPVTSK